MHLAFWSGAHPTSSLPCLLPPTLGNQALASRAPHGGYTCPIRAGFLAWLKEIHTPAGLNKIILGLGSQMFFFQTHFAPSCGCYPGVPIRGQALYSRLLSAQVHEPRERRPLCPGHTPAQFTGRQPHRLPLRTQGCTVATGRGGPGCSWGGCYEASTQGFPTFAVGEATCHFLAKGPPGLWR